MNEPREPLRGLEYWENWIPYTQEKIARKTEKLKTEPFPERWNKDTMTKGLFSDCYALIKHQYSGGIPVHEIKEAYPALIDAWVAYNQSISFGDDKKHLLLKHDYYHVLTLVSWGILFKADGIFFQKIADHLHSNGEDALIETLLVYRLKDRTPANKLIFPQTFRLLEEATRATSTEQETLVKEYLDSWYPNMKEFINYDIHKAKGEGSFDGYWCFEAAAIVALFQIDDSSFRDMLNYPTDMSRNFFAMHNEPA